MIKKNWNQALKKSKEIINQRKQRLNLKPFNQKKKRMIKMKKGKIIEEKEIFNKEKNLLDSDKCFKKPINKIKLKRKKMKENDQNNDATLLWRRI